MAADADSYVPAMSQPVPLTGGEKESLHISLDRHRDVVVWKLESLTDEQLRWPVTPSGTGLADSLVKHLAGVEYGWFCWMVAPGRRPRKRLAMPVTWTSSAS